MTKITPHIDQLTNKSIPISPTQTGACYEVSQPSPSTVDPSPSLSTSPGSPILVDSLLEGSLMDNSGLCISQKLANRCRCLVDMLPDDALLVIFGLCADEEEENRSQQVWETLVHVCRRWRSLVFGSPRHLNLQLICTPRTPARYMLDVWPPSLLVVIVPASRPDRYYDYYRTDYADNIVAALEHRSRVCRIHITDISRLDLEKVLAAMQEPFPELTSLILKSEEKTERVLPGSFLGGSAPHLRILELHHISYPGLPKILSSATHLADLRLYDIPHSGYISPEAMATVLSTLTSLGSLFLRFNFPLSRSHEAIRRPSPPTRLVLPVLEILSLTGVGEYLDDLMVRIDAPLLKKMSITFVNQTPFDTPQLAQFINRTPALKTHEEARVWFLDNLALVDLSSRRSDYHNLDVMIQCENRNWQVSFLERFFTSFMPLLSNLEDLYMFESSYLRSNFQDDIGNAKWLELMQPFPTVKKLYLTKGLVPRFMSSLQELVGERMTEVLPSLQNIFLDGLETLGPVQEGIQQFVATRQASHPIAVSRWDRDKV